MNQALQTDDASALIKAGALPARPGITAFLAVIATLQQGACRVAMGRVPSPVGICSYENQPELRELADLWLLATSDPGRVPIRSLLTAFVQQHATGTLPETQRFFEILRSNIFSRVGRLSRPDVDPCMLLHEAYEVCSPEDITFIERSVKTIAADLFREVLGVNTAARLGGK